MTHSPTLPVGNQSPYPIKELPVSERITSSINEKTAKKDGGAGFWMGLSVAIGIGALGIAIYSFTRLESNKSLLES